MSHIRTVRTIVNAVFVFVLVVAGIFLINRFAGQKISPAGFSFQALIVSSGSMEPAIKTGSIVIVTPVDHYQTGDIITFKSGNDQTTTHRIVGAGIDQFRVAGDANDSPDANLVETSQIVGRVLFSIPHLGYLANMARTPQGFILLVIIPATIIIYEELKSIWKNLPRPKINFPRPSLKPAFYIVPLVGAGLIFLSFTGSLFSDTESSSANSFIAFVTTPTPTIPVPSPTPTPLIPSPGDVIINEVQPLGSTPADEWIELYNRTNFSIDVSGWKIKDALTDDIFPSVTPIPAFSYAVIITNSSSVSGIPAGVVVITLGNTTIGSGLNNLGDSVILTNASGTIIDQMSYGNILAPIFSSPPSAPSVGYTLARSPNGVDTDTAADWSNSSNPSLGVANP